MESHLVLILDALEQENSEVRGCISESRQVNPNGVTPVVMQAEKLERYRCS